MLHTHTLLIVIEIFYLSLGALLWATWRKQSGIEGVRTCILAYVTSALGLFVIMSYAWLAQAITLGAGNMLIVCGALLHVIAVRQLLNVPVQPCKKPMVILLLLYLIFVLYFTLVNDSFSARAIGYSLTMAGIYVALSRTLFNSADREHPSRKILAWLMLSHSVFNLLRAGFEVFSSPDIGYLGEANNLTRWALIEHSVFVVLSTLSLVLLISEKLADQLKSMAYRDPLTGAYNRRAFFEFFDRAVAQHQRSGEVFCLMVADLDNFKTINDKLGHQGGDQVLEAIVRASHQTIRANDVFGRIGGEEFAVLSANTSLRQAGVLAERWRAAIRKVEVEGTVPANTLSISVGVVEIAKDETSAALYKRADGLLYKAKQQGKNQVVSAVSVEQP